MAKIITRYTAPFLVAAHSIVSAIVLGPLFAHDNTDESAASETMKDDHKVPEMNADRSRSLFHEGGCVAGHDGTALDAHSMQPMMNLVDFAAKVWTMMTVPNTILVTPI